MQNDDKLAKLLAFYNPWWSSGKISEELALPFERKQILSLAEAFDTDRIIVIKGPRRTGKSTLMFQLIKWLLGKQIDPKSILFLSFDQFLGADLSSIINLHSTITGYTQAKGKLYCFLDEVHALPNWELEVKRYFDQKIPIQFIVSSSAASLLKTQSESLAGRTLEEIILPFSFSEYYSYVIQTDQERAVELGGVEMLKYFGKIIEKQDWEVLKKENRFIAYENAIKYLWQNYLANGGFPQLFKIQDSILRQKLLRDDIIDKAIYRDIVGLFGINEPEILERLFLYCVSISGDLLNVSNISKKYLEGVSRPTVSNYLSYLKNAYLIFTNAKFSGSGRIKMNAAEKVYVIDNSFLNIFAYPKQDYGVENAVACLLHRQWGKVFYWRDKNEHEVDFIYERQQGDYLPVEVKYASGRPEQQELKGLARFCEDYKCKSAFVVTKDYFAFHEGVWNVPAWLFCLVF